MSQDDHYDLIGDVRVKEQLLEERRLPRKTDPPPYQITGREGSILLCLAEDPSRFEKLAPGLLGLTAIQIAMCLCGASTGPEWAMNTCEFLWADVDRRWRLE